METKTQEVARCFTVQEYHRMAEAGTLHEDDRVELIEGEIVEIAAIDSRHFACANRLNELVMQQVGDPAVVRVPMPPLAGLAHHHRTEGIGTQARSRDPGRAGLAASACRRRHARLYRAGETMGGQK